MWPAWLLPITPLLDLLDQSARLRQPAELAAGTAGADAAVGGHGVSGGALAPFARGFLHGHRRGRAGKAEHAVDGLAGLAHRVLAILGEIEAAGRRSVDRERIERDQIVDMHVGPDVFARAGMRSIAAFFGELDQERHL